MSLISCTRYLFPEAAVADRLAALPSIAGKLKNAAECGSRPSAVYSGYATNPQQLYRVLAGAPVYPWLDLLLESLEYCIKHGWYANKIMTSDRQNFRGVIAELHVAEHFLLRGGDLEPEPERGAARADLRLVIEGVELIIEVVAPIELAPLSDFFETMGDTLKNLDEPYDFRGRVALRQLETFSADGQLLHLNPIVLAKQLFETSLVQDFAAETAAMMAAGDPFRIDRPVPELNLCVTADFPDVDRSPGGPVREIALDLPGLSGYAPEAVFDNILGKVRKKARRRQAGDIDMLRLLVVDVSTGEVSSELGHAWYRPWFQQMFRDRLGPHVGVDYDGIALVEPRAWGAELILHELLFEDERLTRAVADKLFDVRAAGVTV